MTLLIVMAAVVVLFIVYCIIKSGSEYDDEYDKWQKKVYDHNHRTEKSHSAATKRQK